MFRNRANVINSARNHNIHPTFLGLIIATEYGWGVGEATKNNIKMLEGYTRLKLGDTRGGNAILRDTTLGVANISVASAMLLEDLGYINPAIRAGYGNDFDSREWSIAISLHTNEAISIEYTAAYLEYLGDEIDKWASINGVTLTSPTTDSLIAQGYKSGWIHSPKNPQECSSSGACGIGDQLNAGLQRGINPQILVRFIALTGYSPDKIGIETSSSGYIWSVFNKEQRIKVEDALGYCSTYELPSLYVPK